jgi:hypothetical protein
VSVSCSGSDKSRKRPLSESNDDDDKKYKKSKTTGTEQNRNADKPEGKIPDHKKDRQAEEKTIDKGHRRKENQRKERKERKVDNEKDRPSSKRTGDERISKDRKSSSKNGRMSGKSKMQKCFVAVERLKIPHMSSCIGAKLDRHRKVVKWIYTKRRRISSSGNSTEKRRQEQRSLSPSSQSDGEMSDKSVSILVESEALQSQVDIDPPSPHLKPELRQNESDLSLMPGVNVINFFFAKDLGVKQAGKSFPSKPFQSLYFQVTQQSGAML